MNYVYVLVIFFAFCAYDCVAQDQSDEDKKYCRIKKLYCAPKMHALCSQNGMDKCIDQPRKSSTYDQATILSALNTKRNEVAKGTLALDFSNGLPAASNMMKLYWDEELEQIVNEMADICDDWGVCEPDSELCYNTERFPVVCLEAKLVDNATLEEGIDTWLLTGENLTINFGALDFFWYDDTYQVTDWNQFADFAYAKAYKVACFANYTRFMCLLGPRKTNGHPIYWGGEPCSNCPFNTACQPASNNPYLCSRDDVGVEDDDDSPGAAGGGDFEFEADDFGVFHGPNISLTIGAIFILILI